MRRELVPYSTRARRVSFFPLAPNCATPRYPSSSTGPSSSLQFVPLAAGVPRPSVRRHHRRRHRHRRCLPTRDSRFLPLSSSYYRSSPGRLGARYPIKESRPTPVCARPGHNRSSHPLSLSLSLVPLGSRSLFRYGFSSSSYSFSSLRERLVSRRFPPYTPFVFSSVVGTTPGRSRIAAVAPFSRCAVSYPGTAFCIRVRAEGDLSDARFERSGDRG